MFDAVDTVRESLQVFAEMLLKTKFHRKKYEKELVHDFSTATEIADYLVRKGIAFREAHKTTGKIVRACLERGVSLVDLPLSEYRKHSSAFRSDIFTFLDPHLSVEQKKSSGSTSPEEVEKQIRKWRKILSS